MKTAIWSPEIRIPIPIFNLKPQILHAKSQIKSRFLNMRVHHIYTYQLMIQKIDQVSNFLHSGMSVLKSFKPAAV